MNETAKLMDMVAVEIRATEQNKSLADTIHEALLYGGSPSTAYAGALWILTKELFKQQKRLKGIMGHVDMMRKVEDIDFWGAGEQDERL